MSELSGITSQKLINSCVVQISDGLKYRVHCFQLNYFKVKVAQLVTPILTADVSSSSSSSSGQDVHSSYFVGFAFLRKLLSQFLQLTAPPI